MAGEHGSMYRCDQHESFVSAVTDLVSTVSVLSTNITWMERMGRWVAGLCIAIVCLVLVTIFYAGAMYQQVQQNTQMTLKNSHMTEEIVEMMQRYHTPERILEDIRKRAEEGDVYGD